MQFARIIGIDLLRRANPDDELEGPARLSGRRRCAAAEVLPPPSPRKYWMRRGIAEWLVERERLAEDVPTLVGIDHGFSFPLRYFEFHHLPPDWQMACAARARREWESPLARVDRKIRGQREIRLYTSTCKDPWRNPLMPVFVVAETRSDRRCLVKRSGFGVRRY